LQELAGRLLENTMQFVFRILDPSLMKTPPKHSSDLRRPGEAAILWSQAQAESTFQFKRQGYEDCKKKTNI